MITPTLSASPVEPADYTPALLALLGVLIAGIIQVVAQRRRDVEEQVRTIREECTALTAAAADYGGSMAQMVRVAAPAIAEFEASQKWWKKPGLEKFIDDDYWSRLGDSLIENLNKSFRQSLRVAGSKDTRVAEQAMKVHHAIVGAHNEAARLLTGEGQISPERAEKLREEINLEASILLTMVMPTNREKFLRFRSSEDALDEIKYERAQKARHAASTSNDQPSSTTRPEAGA